MLCWKPGSEAACCLTAALERRSAREGGERALVAAGAGAAPRRQGGEVGGWLEASLAGHGWLSSRAAGSARTICTNAESSLIIVQQLAFQLLLLNYGDSSSDARCGVRGRCNDSRAHDPGGAGVPVRRNRAASLQSDNVQAAAEGRDEKVANRNGQSVDEATGTAPGASRKLSRVVGARAESALLTSRRTSLPSRTVGASSSRPTYGPQRLYY